MTVLRGVAWDHTRGWGPMAFTSQVFADHNRDVRIEWDRQSLWDFGEGDIAEMARSYDLVVVDHPMTARMAGSGLFRSFSDEDVVPAVGPSAETYVWQGERWALPLDAACQVSARRDDLLSEAGESLPRTWDDVLSLARRTGRVVMPLTPIDVFSSLLTLSAGIGAPAGTADTSFLDREAALEAFDLLCRIRDVVPPECISRNPIATLEAMAYGDASWYCPLVFGYSNYSRLGYAPRLLAFGDVPRLDRSQPGGGALLGGAGIAVPTTGQAPDLAAGYARWVSSDVVQRGEYVRGGGQPAAVAAWDDPEADRLTNGFFSSTRATIDPASVRPKHPAYPRFQTEAADLIHQHLFGGGTPEGVVDEVERLYDAYGCHGR